ncbi:MAG: FTR1 family protein [Methylophilales bacterium]|nr:FTR1 family protein [Methylophilales bacterium]
MFGTAVIVFREVLEAAIIIGIVAAATRDVPGRSRWIVGGLLLGLIGSALVAASTRQISEFADGLGQELFNAIILGVAVLMLAWHNIWMASHGQQLAANARKVGTAIREGVSELSVLLAVVGIAVLREGSETVLFLYGIATSDQVGASALLLGGAVGVAAGVAVGYTLYKGLLRIPMRWFFSATSVLVLLLAAGMASQAAHYLIQADLIPSLITPLWDTSSVLPEKSIPGMLLHNLVGYDASPAAMQLVFYIVTLVAIWSGMKLVNQPKKLREI